MFDFEVLLAQTRIRKFHPLFPFFEGVSSWDFQVRIKHNKLVLKSRRDSSADLVPPALVTTR